MIYIHFQYADRFEIFFTVIKYHTGLFNNGAGGGQIVSFTRLIDVETYTRRSLNGEPPLHVTGDTAVLHDRAKRGHSHFFIYKPRSGLINFVLRTEISNNIQLTKIFLAGT